MSVYLLEVRVDAARVPEIMAFLLAENGVSILSMIADDTAPKVPAQVRKHGYLNGKRNKGIKSHDLVLLTLSEGPKHRRVLEEAFRLHEFAPTTAATVINDMVRNKKIVTAGAEVFRVA